MWSGPRNLSTAMMYSFASRGDCSVIDEPFYAAYLTATNDVHPMQQAILDAQPTHASDVVNQCLGPKRQFQRENCDEKLTLAKVQMNTKVKLGGSALRKPLKDCEMKPKEKV